MSAASAREADGARNGADKHAAEANAPKAIGPAPARDRSTLASCFICLEGDEESQQPLITGICACKELHVHADCLESMVNTGTRGAQKLQERLLCPVCREPYKVGFQARRVETESRNTRRTMLLRLARATLAMSCAVQFAAVCYLGTFERGDSLRMSWGTLAAEAAILLSICIQASAAYACGSRLTGADGTDGARRAMVIVWPPGRGVDSAGMRRPSSVQTSRAPATAAAASPVAGTTAPA